MLNEMTHCFHIYIVIFFNYKNKKKILNYCKLLSGLIYLLIVSKHNKIDDPINYSVNNNTKFLKYSMQNLKLIKKYNFF